MASICFTRDMEQPFNTSDNQNGFLLVVISCPVNNGLKAINKKISESDLRPFRY